MGQEVGQRGGVGVKRVCVRAGAGKRGTRQARLRVGRGAAAAAPPPPPSLSPSLLHHFSPPASSYLHAAISPLIYSAPFSLRAILLSRLPLRRVLCV